MRRDDINDEYFEWLISIVCDGRYSEKTSFRKLLEHLHRVEFTYTIDKDENRACDGTSLRYRFTLANDYDSDVSNYITGPCSVLEMMVALALRCEETIMDNPEYGNRTGQWFWGMVNNLGLGSMRDVKYDEMFVDYIIQRLLDRRYSPDGDGGLFTVKKCDRDLRDVEIWYQLNWYLDDVLGC